jgi:hypothetical protein
MYFYRKNNVFSSKNSLTGIATRFDKANADFSLISQVRIEQTVK